MRKLAALVSAALVLSLAVPAFAAVEVGGKLGTEFTLGKNDNDEWELTGETGLELETKISAEGGNPVKAIVQLSPWKLESGAFDDDGNPIGEFGDGHESPPPMVRIGIDKAWLEAEGAYWHGGPSVLTRIGDVNIEWDTYVGHLADKRGVTVEGVEVGPVTADAFYTWDGADRPVGLAARGTVEGVDLSGMVVKRGEESNFIVGAGLNVMPGMDVNAKLALDGERRQLYRVEATADNLIEGIKLTVGYRGADDAFDPMYTHRWEITIRARTRSTTCTMGSTSLRRRCRAASASRATTTTRPVRPTSTSAGIWNSPALLSPASTTPRSGVTKTWSTPSRLAPPST